MKKAISIILTLALLVTLALPCFAIDEFPERDKTPTIMIYGDGEAIYDTDGNMIFHFSEMLDMLNDTEDGALSEATMNVLKPFLLEGVLQDKWDNYYDALGKEIGDIFEEAHYDKNGENPNGSDVSAACREQMLKDISADKADNNGEYWIYDYVFRYDWRQDPLETADELNAYVKGIKKATNCDKVSIMSYCLGTSVLMAYISKYGTDDLKGVSFDGGVVTGAEIISEPISGKFKLDANAINRMLYDLDALGTVDIDEFITASIDLVKKSGAIDAVKDFAIEPLYAKLVQGVTSALATSTFFTWPGYWACVAESDYENALDYVFGKAGSEKRKEYAGLIEKIENYNVNVRQKMDEILDEIDDSGINIAVFSKYGFQVTPICQSNDAIADQYVSVKLSSFGATTGTIYSTLSDSYIQNRINEGKGKYISPDKQIDASTCRFPDNTWFVKGVSHSDWGPETNFIYSIVNADERLTVDDFSLSQFIVGDSKTVTLETMTTSNCNTESWVAREELDNPKTDEGKLVAFLKSLMSWLTALFNKFASMLNGSK